MKAITTVRTGRSQSLKSRIHQDLRNRIHRGEMGREERLVDTEIAARLGVSRMPVREALLQLTHEGYLVGTTRGFMLPRLTPGDIADIFEVRRLLEPRAAAHAARDIDAAGLAMLDRAVADAGRAAATGDADMLHKANVAFRAAWLAAVRNKRLAATIARFSDHVQVVRLRTLGHPPTQRLVADNLALLRDAFGAHDSVAASDRMRRFTELAEAAFAELTRADEESGHTEPAARVGT